jgi:hypothetical protein
MTELNEQAVEAAVQVVYHRTRGAEISGVTDGGIPLRHIGLDPLLREAIAAYFASLAEQGERMVSAREVEQARADAIREVTEWLWTSAPVAKAWQREQLADAATRRFAPTEAER